MATYQATNACTWRNGFWIAGLTTQIRQGVYTSASSFENVGVLLFDLTSIRDMYVDFYPTSASIKLNRTGSGSYSLARTMTLFAGNASGMPAPGNNTSPTGSRPTKVTPGYSYSVPGGQGVKNIAISTALIESMASGASNCIFMDVGTSTTNYMGFIGRDDLSQIVLTINWESRTTACSAPTACSVNATLAEGNVTLSWSGATSGINNAISSYEIQYSDSSNNSTWGPWTALTTIDTTTTSGSISVAPPSTRGHYRRFQVRTRGEAGESYYSDYKVSTNSVRRNTMPSPPTTVTASPAIYSDETINLSWSGAAGGTSAIKGFILSSRTSLDNSSWEPWDVLATLTLAASGGTYQPSVSRVPGTYTQFRVQTLDALDVSSLETISNSIYCSITPCIAPTTFTVSPTIAETTATLSWSGASGGAGNAITGYEIQYRTSSDNTSWDAWQLLSVVSSTATHGSLTVNPPLVRGDYRQFQIRTQGAAGESFFSEWMISTNSLRKNILPTPPSVFSASPAIYETPTITLTWSGTIAGTSAIKQYVIQRATSTNGITWSNYETVTTIVSSATFGTTTTSASLVAGMYTRYRIAVMDSLDAISIYGISNTIKKNSPPTAPIIDAPKSGSLIYNQTPRFLIVMGIEPDGQTQILEVKIDSGPWFNSINDPELFSTSGYLANSVKTVFQAPTQLIGNHTITFRSLDSDIQSKSAEVVRIITILASPFEEIVADITPVKADHIKAIRNAANTARNYYGLSSFTWSKEVTAGKTTMKEWSAHVIEIRRSLSPIKTKVNDFDPNSTIFDFLSVDWLPVGTGRPRADVMNQFHTVVFTL